VSVVVPIVLFLRFLVLILILVLLLFLSVFVTGVLAAPHVLIVLCLFLVLVGLAILVINPKEKNNNFMDLSPFVFTRNIPPYSPSSGLCVCGCPDYLIPPFFRIDTGPCPFIVPECFVTGVLVGGVMASPHVLIVLIGLAILVINPKEKNNNFMDLSPFVFTRNIPPYSPSSGLCVCGCPDCLIPPFPRTDTGPCPLICPECFCHWCPGWWCHGCPSCLDCPRCPMPLPCPCW